MGVEPRFKVTAPVPHHHDGHRRHQFDRPSGISGPGVIDGRSNQLGALMTRLMSRRSSGMIMERVTDPNRASKPAAS